MNNKMTTNSQVLINEPKRKEKQQKPSKQQEQEQNHRNGGISLGRGKGRIGRKGTGKRKHN